MSTTTTDRYQSERHREHVLQMLEIAGREIARGWCEGAGLDSEELRDFSVAAQGDIDLLDDLMWVLSGREMPSGYSDPRAEEWDAAFKGINAYAEEVAE